MQHRTPSPNTQSRASVKFRAVILVLSKQFLSFTRVFHLKQLRPKTHTPTRHRRTTAVRDAGFGNPGRALHVLERGHTGANAGAFTGNAAVPPGAHSARFKPGVSYHHTYGY